MKAIDVEQRDVHVDLTLAAISGSFFAPGFRYPKNEDGLESDVCQSYRQSCRCGKVLWP